MIWRENILNFRGPDTENIDFWRSGEVQGEKILNFKGLENKNFDFWRSGEVWGGLEGLFGAIETPGPQAPCLGNSAIFIWISHRFRIAFA